MNLLNQIYKHAELHATRPKDTDRKEEKDSDSEKYKGKGVQLRGEERTLQEGGKLQQRATDRERD